VDAAEDVLL
jgi:hypothetical protein